jgi:hypothetical protein
MIDPYNTAIRATVTPSALTPREIAANVAALDLPDGWTRADDLALMEGLFLGLGLQAIGSKIGKPFGAAQARFLALRKAAVGEGVLTLDAQTALLAAVRAAA